MDILIQGVLLGGLYCAASLGLSLVFGVLGLVNLAHGQLLVVGALLTSVVVTASGVDPLLSGLAVAAVTAALAFLLQAGLLTPILRRSPEATIPATFGVSIVIYSLLLIFLGSTPKVIDAPYATASVDVLGVSVRWSLVISLVVALFMTWGLHELLQRSRFGTEVRAAAADADAAEMVGISVQTRYAWVFAIAAFTASIGGTLVGLSFAVDPASGMGWLVRAFTVVVLGGLGSIRGTLVGAMIVGLIESIGAQVFGPEYRDVVVFGLLVVILLVRPQGLASLWPAGGLRQIRRSVKTEGASA